MNTRALSLLLVLTALGLQSPRLLADGAESRHPVAIDIQSVTLVSNSGLRIARGAEFGDVFFAMKYKNRERLARNVWVFHGFQTENPLAGTDCRSVVVTFADGRVTNLQLVNRLAVTALAARMRVASPDRLLASH